MSTLKYDKNIIAAARWLAKGDPFLAEELRSEMHLKLLQTEKQGKTLCLHIARQAAIDFLRSRKHCYSWNDKFKHVSLSKMREKGLQIDTDCNIYMGE